VARLSRRIPRDCTSASHSVRRLPMTRDMTPQRLLCLSKERLGSVLGHIQLGVAAMPRQTRRLVIPLPHKAQSGLFLLRSGEYIADIKPVKAGATDAVSGPTRHALARSFNASATSSDSNAKRRTTHG